MDGRTEETGQTAITFKWTAEVMTPAVVCFPLMSQRCEGSKELAGWLDVFVELQK